MKRWTIALLIVLISCFPIVLNHARAGSLLEDTDTAVLLRAVRARNAPLSWFAGDWPLENHFYRPVSTLSFELDNKLYGNYASGYGLTNALLVSACVLLLFWFFRELTDHAVLSAGSACLFALWSSGTYFRLLSLAFWGLALVALVTAFLSRRKFWVSVFASLVASYAGFELSAAQVTNESVLQLPGFMLSWLPGRTASVMTLFALAAMAAYARYERISAARLKDAEGALDLPATKSSSQQVKIKRPWQWIVLAGLACAMALGSYEQAVMLPAALFGVALCLRFQRYQVRWGWQCLFWGLLIGYMVLRKEVIPAGVSHYQQQQFRQGPSVALSILSYMFPAVTELKSFPILLGTAGEYGASSGGSIWMTPVVLAVNAQFWSAVHFITCNVAGFIAARKRWIFALTGWALSVVTYLPMAWLKPFGHYDFWPLAMRSLFATTLAWVAWDYFVNAGSLPALQAPPRPDPAPGSLPRR